MLPDHYPWYVTATFLVLINGVAIPIAVGLITGDWRWLIVSGLCSLALWVWLFKQ